MNSVLRGISSWHLVKGGGMCTQLGKRKRFANWISSGHLLSYQLGCCSKFSISSPYPNREPVNREPRTWTSHPGRGSRLQHHSRWWTWVCTIVVALKSSFIFWSEICALRFTLWCSPTWAFGETWTGSVSLGLRCAEPSSPGWHFHSSLNAVTCSVALRSRDCHGFQKTGKYPRFWYPGSIRVYPWVLYNKPRIYGLSGPSVAIFGSHTSTYETQRQQLIVYYCSIVGG